jgi:hypothetical protein
VWGYEGIDSFSEDQAFLVNLEKGMALPLQPLVFWDFCSRHPELAGGHCFLFDLMAGSPGTQLISFKAIGFPCSRTLSEGKSTEYRDLIAAIDGAKRTDPQCSRIEGLSFVELSSEP